MHWLCALLLHWASKASIRKQRSTNERCTACCNSVGTSVCIIQLLIVNAVPVAIQCGKLCSLRSATSGALFICKHSTVKWTSCNAI